MKKQKLLSKENPIKEILKYRRNILKYNKLIKKI